MRRTLFFILCLTAVLLFRKPDMITDMLLTEHSEIGEESSEDSEDLNGSNGSGEDEEFEEYQEPDKTEEAEEPEDDDVQDNVFSLDDIPEYSGQPYVDINGDIPFFTEEEMTSEPFEHYGELDNYERCTAATACVGPETMPTEKRGPIGMIKPTGWHTVKYDFINGKYLYNRCHLIGYQLTGENANPLNLITGTRYLNVEGMLPFENSVADYVRGTGNHVMYRVTPIFDGEDLLAKGVLMEAKSVEDPLVQFCVFCYNVQPGVEIDYRTGDNRLAE